MSWGPAPAAAARSANGVIMDDASVGAAGADKGPAGTGGKPGADAMIQRSDEEET